MRRPYLQFYPGDWQANSKLKQCSHTEKGVWIDVLCILHEQDEYGIVRWPLLALNRAVSGRIRDLKSLQTKGVLKGADVGERCEPFIYVPHSGRKDGEPVTLIPAQDGPIWYSPRMVRDEHVRKTAGASTRFTSDSPSRSPRQRQGLHPSSSSSSDPSSYPNLNDPTVVESSPPRPPEKVEEEEARQSKFSTSEWEKYVASHPGIVNPEKFLNSAATGKHDRNMRLWLEQTNGANKPGPERASERNARNFKGNLEYLRSLSSEGGPVDTEDAAGLLDS